MPTPTYTPLANITLGSSAASVTFSSISQAYRDLVFVISGTGTAVLSFNYIFNNDSGANYSQISMRGDGTTASSSSSTGASGPMTTTANLSNTTPSAYVLNVVDYSATDKHKTSLSRGNGVNYGTNAIATRWASTSALTTVKFQTVADSFATGMTFTLYGVAA